MWARLYRLSARLVPIFHYSCTESMSLSRLCRLANRWDNCSVCGKKFITLVQNQGICPGCTYLQIGEIAVVSVARKGCFADVQDIIAQDPDCLGSMFVLIILGSDKTMVSVATGQNDYYPLYLSIGNIRNNVCRAHRNSVVLIRFLAMPKSM